MYTSLENVNESGTDERASSFLLFVDGDDFANASAISPAYLKVSLPEDVSLSRTLVGSNQAPIYLALNLLENGGISPGVQVNAGREAIALVRYVAGESELWLRFSESSRGWLRLAEEEQAPSPTSQVLIQFGLEGLESLGLSLSRHQLGLANLPFNTKILATNGDPSDSADTVVRIDLSQGQYSEGSIIQANLNVFASAQGVEFSLDPAMIVSGMPLNVLVNQITPIAMVFPRSTSMFFDFLVETQPQPLLSLSSCENSGDLVVLARAGAFPSANPNQPVFLRLQLSSDAKLCKTLVDPREPEALPIYLAMQLAEPLSDGQITAPADTVSLIRWIAGEDAIWLKIIHSSSDWMIQGQSAPLGGAFISFRIGQTGGESLQANQNPFALGLANLPANTADLSGFSPSGTEIEVDLSSGGISPFSPDLWGHVRTYSGSAGVETSQTQAGIQVGTSLGLESGGLLGYLTAGILPWEGLVLSSVPKEIEPSGQCEVTGNLSIIVGDDLFPFVSPSDPVYLQFALPDDTLLCETLVDPANPDPILLAISLENSAAQVKVIAPADTVSIVRWVQGESNIWLKIKHPTGTWLTNAGVPQPLDLAAVKFGFGINDATSATVNAVLYQQEQANLPANTRASSLPLDLAPVSTLITVDVSNASMVPNPEPGDAWRAYITLDPGAWQQMQLIETSLNLNQVPPGVAYPLSFQGIRDIAFSTTVTADPAVAVQGLDVLTMDARVADDVNPVEFKWINRETGIIVSEFQSIIFDPIPTGTVKLRLEMRDYLGRVSTSEGILLVNPSTFDLNQDGENNILDLFFALPDWGKSRNILFLLSIPL